MQAIQILLVEDTLSDVKLMEHWLSASDLVDQLRVVRDGEQALELLRRERESRARPDLVLLDVNLPRLSGFDVLSQIRADSLLHDLPVIILTGTLARRDVERARALQADRCLQKPSDADEFSERVLELI